MPFGNVFSAALGDSDKREFVLFFPFSNDIALHCFTHYFCNTHVLFRGDLANYPQEFFVCENCGSFHVIRMIYVIGETVNAEERGSKMGNRCRMNGGGVRYEIRTFEASLEAFRSLCIAPPPEIRLVFESLNQLSIKGSRLQYGRILHLLRTAV